MSISGEPHTPARRYLDSISLVLQLLRWDPTMPTVAAACVDECSKSQSWMPQLTLAFLFAVSSRLIGVHPIKVRASTKL